ncbi:MAG: response regulator transcription factor [Thermoleophilaceae bacterium]|nr:response regulator transcription factor [Thermoleophilaceae bacterium]
MTAAPSDGLVRPSLLLADDDAVVRSILTGQMGSSFDVLPAAADADEAIELAERMRPDAALIDVNMPGGGGLTAVREIARRSPETCLVVLSADETRESVVELLDAGAMAYVRKGASGAEIVETLEASIRAHAALAAG